MADVLIVGGGPAGVQAALYTLRAGIATQIFCEENTALRRAESIENYYGLERPIEGAELYRRGLAQAQALGAQIVREQVVSVEYGTGGYRVVTENAAYDGRFLLLAVGSARKTVSLDGAERLTGHGVSYCATCDAFFYRG